MPKKLITKEIKFASYASMFNESDKGCVLLIASLCEGVLEKIHEAAILANLGSEAPKKFFKEKLLTNRAPLSDFNGKITVAFSYGIINLAMYEVLNIIRNLRNEAAHCFFDFGLNDAGVRAHIKKLEAYYDNIDEKLIMKFERFLQKVDTENIVKFRLLVRSYVIISELQDILVIQLERLLKVRGIDVSNEG